MAALPHRPRSVTTLHSPQTAASHFTINDGDQLPNPLSVLFVISGSHRLLFQNNRLVEETKNTSQEKKEQQPNNETGTDVPTAAAAGDLAGRLQYFQTEQHSIPSLAFSFS